MAAWRGSPTESRCFETPFKGLPQEDVEERPRRYIEQHIFEEMVGMSFGRALHHAMYRWKQASHGVKCRQNTNEMLLKARMKLEANQHHTIQTLQQKHCCMVAEAYYMARQFEILGCPSPSASLKSQSLSNTESSTRPPANASDEESNQQPERTDRRVRLNPAPMNVVIYFWQTVL